MASTDLGKELECSVCLDFYTDPVTLTCGHNFCRRCIDRVLNTQEGSGGYSCPECKESFQTRPALQKNLKLCNIVENFLYTQPGEEETRISCTYCIHMDVPAVKSCLLCEASLCDNHLKVHSKSPEHVLCDPATTLETRKCSVHKKILEYFCTEDSMCICVSCSLAGEHRGHQVETLDKASEIRKKTLRNVLHTLTRMMEQTKKRAEGLQEHKTKVLEKAAGETERVTSMFRELRRHLEDLEKKVLSELSGQEERVSLFISDMIKKLEIRKEDLLGKMRRIEKLCSMMDPLTILQDSGDLCDIDDDNPMGGQRDHRPEEDLDLDGISHTLHSGLSEIMTQVIDPKCPPTQVPQSAMKDVTEEPSRAPSSDVQPHQSGGANIGAVPQPSEVSKVTDLLLDVRTAGNNLIMHDRKSVSWTMHSQHRPETAELFQDPQVISVQRFSSGRHYWEVYTKGHCRVGMCYPSMARRGDHSGIGYNRGSWCLNKWDDHYSVRHNSRETPVDKKASTNKIRVELDYEAGRISFYEAVDPIQHLYTFTTTFTEPLHAALWGYSIGII